MRVSARACITLFAAMIIPDAVRLQYIENLLGGLAMHLGGPEILRLGVPCLCRGCRRPDTFRRREHVDHRRERRDESRRRRRCAASGFQKPHRQFGTTYRIINLIADLQVITIVASRGETYLLGEAYAFGIVWSFFLKALSVLVLRFQRNDQEYKTPLNIRIGRYEIPFGLAMTTGVLFFVAIANLFSKRIATISGVAFMLICSYLYDFGKLTHRSKATQRARAIQSGSSDRRR